MSTKTYFINSPDATYNDNEFAWFQSLMLSEGIIGDDIGDIGKEVTENAVPDMSVLVSAGKSLIEVTIGGRTFKVVIELDAEEQVVVPANATGTDRVDAIIVRVDKDTTPNALKTNISTIELITGSGVSSLSDAAIDTAVGDDGWYRLADVTVTNGDTDITTSQITDTRAKVTFIDGMAFSAEFIIASLGAVDSGKVPTLNGEGELDGSFLKKPIIKTFILTNIFGDSTTQFDITNPSGSTYRYTYDSVGLDPTISAASLPIGTDINIAGDNFSAGNNGLFVITASGPDYFEITNVDGVVESNKTLGVTGKINYVWVKPVYLSTHIRVRMVGGGGGGAGADTDSTGEMGATGAGAGYSEKIILKSDLASFEDIIAGFAGLVGNTASAPTGGGDGGDSSFGSHLSAEGGKAGIIGTAKFSLPGSGIGGDINIDGQYGEGELNSIAHYSRGGDSRLGRGGLNYGGSGRITAPSGYGAGGRGGSDNDAQQPSAGTQGVLIIEEF